MRFNPYELVEETDTHRVFQYNSACSYWIYGILAVLLVEFAVETQWLSYIVAVLAIFYLALVMIPGFKIASQIRRAARVAGVQISGSRWSFERPLTYRVLKVGEPAENDD